MDQKKVDRINSLALKEKTIGLTPEEKEEQQQLRRWYVSLWRRSLEAELDNTYIVGTDGKKRKIRKKTDTKK